MADIAPASFQEFFAIVARWDEALRRFEAISVGVEESLRALTVAAMESACNVEAAVAMGAVGHRITIGSPSSAFQANEIAVRRDPCDPFFSPPIYNSTAFVDYVPPGGLT